MTTYITDVDLFDVTSSVSIPFYYVLLPIAEDIKATFLYNYYTRDEGVSETVSLDSIDAETDQYRFVLENWEEGILPRQVNLTFASSNKYVSENLGTGVLTSAVNEGKVIFEDAPFSNNFASVIVNDTSVDEKIYQSDAAIGDTETSATTSTRVITRDFLSAARNESLGYRSSNAQASAEVLELYQNDIKSLNLSISLNTLFAFDVLKTSARWQASAFVDEFASTFVDAENTQNLAREGVTSVFSITENEIDVNLSAYESLFISNPPEVPVPEDFSENTTTKVGYIIEKYGEQIDGSTLRYPDIVIEDPDATSYTDQFVRYGGVYKYKIRTVYRSIVIGVDTQASSGFNTYTISKVLFASTGFSTALQCLETTPPPPPNNISFQQTLSGLYVRWNFPVDTQKDIKRFQIFRRSSVAEPFELIREINFDTTIYPYSSGEQVPESLVERYTYPVKHFVDSEFVNIDSDYIYALCCIDAHGYSSSYSEQFRVRFDNITGKLIISRVSTEGAPKPYPNVNILGDFFSDIIKDSNHSRVRIYFDPEYADVTREGASLSLISTTSTGEATYKMCLTEINIGQSKTVDIVVGDSRIGAEGVPVSVGRFYVAS